MLPLSKQRTYERTPTGFLMRVYRNMRSRVEGVQKNRAHLYVGLPILEKADFYAWARGNVEFWRLFKLWVAGGYRRTQTPSVNRLDPEKGYVLSNIEWVTASLNSSLARHRAAGAFQRIYDAIA